MNSGMYITRAWNLLWKHKALYLLGLGGVMVYNGPVIILYVLMFSTLKNVDQWSDTISRIIRTTPASIWVLIGLGLLVGWAGLLYLSLSFRAAQFRGAWQADVADTGEYSFGQLWVNGRPYVLRMVLFSLITGAIVMAWFLVLMLLFSLGVVYDRYELLCLAVPWMLILLAVIFFFEIYFQLGVASIVVENLGVGAAMKRAWNLTMHNKVTVVVLSFFISLIGIGVSMVIQTPMTLFTNLAGSFFSTSNVVFIVEIISLIFMLISSLLSGLLISFRDTTWVVAFNQLTRPASPAEPPDLTSAEPIQIEA